VIELEREVQATTIPYGQRMPLPKGSKVEITQELGGSFTVLTDYGLMRIEGRDADALGREKPAGTPQVPADAPKDPKEIATLVWDQLKTCYDPEIPVNIVELGLVYENLIEPHAEGGWKVKVKMTLTAPGCGMGGILQSEAQGKISALPGVRESQVELVWDPPWTTSMMSDAAKLQLGFM
jgi:probable FeS assembly SUF system protein SufT